MFRKEPGLFQAVSLGLWAKIVACMKCRELRPKCLGAQDPIQACSELQSKQAESPSSHCAWQFPSMCKANGARPGNLCFQDLASIRTWVVCQYRETKTNNAQMFAFAKFAIWWDQTQWLWNQLKETKFTRHNTYFHRYMEKKKTYQD